ncbi:VOC family protein [Pandoraea sp. NPDC087047]|uniref:VOC family protein n=1 Tax=Pandoraea sp. NPDC087047 TaxID=3364390 RepID=UPI0038272F61
MVRVTDVLYVRYQVTDLIRMESFLRDFGMYPAVPCDGQRLLMRGSGDAPYVYEAVLGETCRFLGAGLQVASRDDLVRLAALDGSGSIEAMSEISTGGERVRMRMPDGFEIDAVLCAGVPGAVRTPLDPDFNSAHSKPRKNESVRVSRTPWPVKRLGHFVLHVSDHDASVNWLRERLGLLASDHLGVPGEPVRVIGSFLRVDGGKHWVDHHCMLIVQSPEPGVHHCSFEMDGLDAVMAAHDFLLEKGYTLDCGVGRHLLGSQIFDYWRDPFGFRIEHYTDGDVVNDEHRATVFTGTADETTQWGAKPPKDFFE